MHLRVAGQCEIREHRHAAGAVHLRAGLLGEHPADWAGLHTGGPDLRGGWDALNVAVGVLDVDTVGVHVGDRRAQLHLHTDLAQPLAGQAAELLAEGRQHRGAGFHQHDAGGGRIDAAEVPTQRAPGELSDLTGHLHTGRTGADDHEGQQPVQLSLVACQLRQLGGPEDPPPQLKRVIDALQP